ncbi:carboxymuconolactone decarboxylase family protein [Amycolatopsis taiwanensis]|uniref:Carboxymuconolactone decarboxylase-like domain-containing protein n=1 Tax=Amycolatopsis taiwanensis TaxID=342230 RepID=A0A9W6R2T6_9PSEU|nr:carboxymuconolactone decarboxylase family protein [Amycolatopsis taiwanensis]GLY66617.1 hypothetical protein Atai01_32360 [Amycolatopsis taiwanensis]
MTGALPLHLTVGRQTGAGWAELREVLRHLAPFAGYPAVVEAFARLAEIQGAQDRLLAGERPASG